MDIGKSFSFVFEDEKWIEKVLIGGLVSLIPIVGIFILMGYGVKLVRNVRNHDPNPLPEWTDWGELIADGLKLFIITFIWTLPLVILYMLIVIPMAMTDPENPSALASTMAMCFGCFAFLYGIIVWLALPAIVIKFAETGEISSGFKFGEILGFVKKHLGQIVIVALISLVVYTIAGFGIVLCVIGLLFTNFWAYMVQYHMIAQIGLEEAPGQSYEVFPEPDPLEELASGEADEMLE